MNYIRNIVSIFTSNNNLSSEKLRCRFNHSLADKIETNELTQNIAVSKINMHELYDEIQKNKTLTNEEITILNDIFKHKEFEEDFSAYKNIHFINSLCESRIHVQNIQSTSNFTLAVKISDAHLQKN